MGIHDLGSHAATMAFGKHQGSIPLHDLTELSFWEVYLVKTECHGYWVVLVFNGCTW